MHWNISHIKEGNSVICRDMDGPTIQSEVSQEEKNKYHIIYREFRKMV